MKIQNFSNFNINEGLRVNPKFLYKLNKEQSIKDTIDDLTILQELILFYYKENDIKQREMEIGDVVLELRKWQAEGWKGVKFLGSEWIPISELTKK